MTIRSFTGESLVCGWFDERGKLIDVQQYSNAEEASECAAQFRKEYPTFIGRIEDVTDMSEERPIPEHYHYSVRSSLQQTLAVSAQPNKADEISRYLYMLYEAQKCGHAVHEEISEGLIALKAALGV